MVAATGTTDGAVTVSSDAAVDCVESFCSGTNSAATTCENYTTYSVSAIIPAPTTRQQHRMQLNLNPNLFWLSLNLLILKK